MRGVAVGVVLATSVDLHLAVTIPEAPLGLVETAMPKRRFQA